MVEYTKDEIVGKSILRRFRELYDWVNGKVGTIEKDVSDAVKQAEEASVEAVQASADAEDAKNKATAASTKVDAFDGRLTALDTEVGTLSTDLGDTEVDVANAQADILKRVLIDQGTGRGGQFLVVDNEGLVTTKGIAIGSYESIEATKIESYIYTQMEFNDDMSMGWVIYNLSRSVRAVVSVVLSTGEKKSSVVYVPVGRFYTTPASATPLLIEGDISITTGTVYFTLGSDTASLSFDFIINAYSSGRRFQAVVETISSTNLGDRTATVTIEDIEIELRNPF